MPLLLYGVTSAAVQLDNSRGVAGSPVLRLSVDDLAIHYSETQDPNLWLRAPLASSAAEFHRVQRELFRSAAILPFRFPTILESHAKLHEHFADRAGDYKSLLDRFANCAQLDILLIYANEFPAPVSGAEYLRERQSRSRALDRFAEKLRNEAATLLLDWRQRSVSNGLRCFGMVQRQQIEEFNETIRRISVPPQIGARVTGPWPVAEFLDLKL